MFLSQCVTEDTVTMLVIEHELQIMTDGLVASEDPLVKQQTAGRSVSRPGIAVLIVLSAGGCEPTCCSFSFISLL